MVRNIADPTPCEGAGRVLTSDDRVWDLCKWVGRGGGERHEVHVVCCCDGLGGGGRVRVRVRVRECALFVGGGGS